MPSTPSNQAITRRSAMTRLAAATAGVAAASTLNADQNETQAAQPAPKADLFRISLAQWSLHPLLFDNELDNLEFAAESKRLGFDAIEYVNAFFKDKARDTKYLAEMNKRAADAGVEQLLIMVDGEGNLGAADATERGQAVDNHVKWLEAAAALGCHSIRVNAASEGTWDEQQALAADGLGRLARLAEGYDLNVIVENHGGLSSNGKWLANVMRNVNHPRCGTLPDFGNFCMDWSRADDPDAWYDRYQGVDELMPFAKAVSAKSHDFDADGNETNTDYRRMLKIVQAWDYTGWIGVEFEGKGVSPREGSVLTRKLLETVRAELAAG